MEYLLDNISFVFTLIMLMFAVINDIKTKTIKNIIPMSFLLIGIIFNIFIHNANIVLSIIISFLYFFLLYYIPKSVNIHEFMGAGDIKIYMVISFLMGWKFSLYSFVYSIFIGAVILLLLNIKRYKEVGFNAFMFLTRRGKWEIKEEEHKTNIFSPYILIGVVVTYYTLVCLNNDWIFQNIYNLYSSMIK